MKQQLKRGYTLKNHYEEKINRLQRIIQTLKAENKRLEHRASAVTTERDALKRLVNHD